MVTKLSQSISDMIILEEKSSVWTVETFEFSDETSESLKGIAERSFNSWQFEKLLNSASDLLDRATQARSKIRDLEGQRLAFNQSRASQDLALDVEDFGLRVKERIYDGIKVEYSYHASSIAESKLRKELLERTGGALGSGTSEMKSAVAKALDLYDHGEGIDVKLGHRLQYHQANSELSRLEAAEIQNNLSIYLSEMELETSQFEFDNRAKSLQLALAQFKERDAAATGEGPLNYSMEIDIWFDVMRRDFLEASARLYAAVDGINKAFGVSHLYELKSKTLSQAVIDASKFARQLNYWLALATQHDQSFTICVPLKTQLAEEEWGNFIDGQRVLFAPNSEYFQGWIHSRLRGISAMYWSASLSQSIGLRFFPPKSIEGRDSGTIDQSDAPEVTIGRVSRFDAPHAMEVAGAVSLMNLGPDGEWWIAFDRRLPVDTAAIAELEIYIHCVGIPEKSYSRLIRREE